MTNLEELKYEINRLNKENYFLRSSLHDAIARPMGVVPKSAEPYYEPERFLTPSQRKEIKGGL